jgi:multidrug resistance efflux pump
VRLEIDTAWDTLATASVDLEDGQTKQATATAKAALAVSRAEQDLADARETVDELTAGADSLELSRLEKQLAVAQATLDDAGVALATLTGTVDPLELDVVRDSVALAEAGLAEAQADLTELRGGPDQLRVTLRRAEVEAGRTALSAAIDRFERSTLAAPWDGFVSFIGVDAGQAVNAGTTIVEIVDPAVVELDGIVDEIDVLFIRNGASATILMDALPGETLRGSVSAVASAAQSQQGVVTYPIRIRIAVPDSVQLPEGLSAVASVVIREDNDVLLVPLQSLRGSFDQPAVQVMFNGRLEERAVTLGNNDDFWVVIESGLSEGDMVVVEAQSASTTGSFGFGGRELRRFSGQFGGGGSGGGFGGGRGFDDHN